MAKFRFFLRDSKKADSAIYLSVTYSNNRVKLPTGQKIKVKAWNDKSRSIRSNYIEYSEAQDELDRIERVAKQTVKSLLEEYGQLPNEKELKKILDARVLVKSIAKERLDFLGYLEEYIKKLPKKKNARTNKPISKGTIEGYNQTLKRIRAYEKDTGNIISFMTLSNKTYDSLIEYFEAKLNFKPNTIGKHIKNLKAVINNAKDIDGISVSEHYKPSYWKVYKLTKTKEEIVFLSEDELNELDGLNFENKIELDKTRDIFLVGAWTALRISDIVDLKIEDVDFERGIIIKHTKKTDKQVAIPIHPVVIRILEKYDGKMPKQAEQTVNKNIKMICKDIRSMHKKIRFTEIKGNISQLVEFKRYEMVTTHSARKSFASNCYKRKDSIQDIMAVTGHTKEADFFRYIGVSNDERVMRLAEKFRERYG